MERMPNIVSVSTFRNEYNQVFSMLDDGPVVIAARSKPAGMLVSPAMWNAIVDRLEDQDALIEGLNDLLQIERGEEALIDLDPSTIATMAAGDALPA